MGVQGAQQPEPAVFWPADTRAGHSSPYFLCMALVAAAQGLFMALPSGALSHGATLCIYDTVSMTHCTTS